LTDSIRIHRALSPDLGAIIALRVEFERITRDSGSFDEGARRAELAELLGRDLASGRLLGWLAEDDGRPFAQAGLRLGGRAGAPRGTRQGGDGELLNVYCESAYRGRGIGSALVEAAIAEALTLGLSRITLQPTEDSRRIYERAGFRADRGRMALELGTRAL
jgi:GNAT superfamily N-acetyltransferase